MDNGTGLDAQEAGLGLDRAPGFLHAALRGFQALLISHAEA